MKEFFNDFKDIKSNEDALILFTEIMLGYSHDYENNLFIKHSSILDIGNLTAQNKKTEKESKIKGLLKEKDKLKILFANGSWTEKEEENFQSQLKKIEDLKISKRKLVFEVQIKSAEEILKREVEKLSDLYSERSYYILPTIESFTNEKLSEFYILNYLYKNETLTEKVYSVEDFEEMSKVEINKIYEYYLSFESIFSERNLKKIAAAPFIFNLFSLSDSASDFFGKPVASMTLNQTNCYSNFLYFKNIINHPDFKSIPQEYHSDIEKLVNYYDQQYGFIAAKNKSKK